MHFSKFEFVGFSQDNGFPVIKTELDAEEVTGKTYRKFNQTLAAELEQYKEYGMVNLILVAKNPHMGLPGALEVYKALKTPEGRFLEELFRYLVIVGFKNKVITFLSKFSSQTTGVKVVLVDTVEEAEQLLKLKRSAR